VAPDAVKLEGGEVMGAYDCLFWLRVAFPVLGHVGLIAATCPTPWWLFKVQGLDDATAAQVKRDAQAVAQGGAYWFGLGGVDREGGLRHHLPS